VRSEADILVAWAGAFLGAAVVVNQHIPSLRYYPDILAAAKMMKV
jgi:hypothetical protein